MGKIKLLNVGFGNIIPTNEVIAIVSPASAPIKRLIQKAKEEKGLKNEVTGKEIGLMDLTQGRKTRSVVVTDYGRVYLSSLQPETIVNRVKDDKVLLSDEEPEVEIVLAKKPKAKKSKKK
ncbi:MAG: DUF370 domain-containing protein [Candidatus Sericytochromatia bacterium]|nr:DUF370 domain-containing protein [Candidatus Sericytochromatia bacterium]